MTVAVSILPEQQLAVLNEAYRKAVARSRHRTMLAMAVCVAVLVAPNGAEVNFGTLFDKFGNIVSYFDRIFTLETDHGSGPMSANGSGAGANGCACSANQF